MHSRFLFTLALGLGGTLLSPAATPTTHFETRIRPLLIHRCLECHGPEKQKGGLRLDSREGWLKGGASGPALVPGDVTNSLLLRAVRHTDPDLKMPPEKKGGKLSARDIADLETWVKSGAPDPRTSAAPKKRQPPSDPKPLWSFQPVRPITPPPVRQPNWVQTPVDAFILARLEALNLTPAPPADARTLVRRAYFDLLGLPPTPDQVDAFIQDRQPGAWARLIDQLLESKHYGERWGRHWLDVARYADSGGFETDIYYRNAWRYRDYVVKSFNDDKPYNVFVQEQVAGDELWPDDISLQGNYTIAPDKVRHLEALTGTGFYTLGPQVHESNMDEKKIRYETFADWVDTTGAAFLGLTLGCARCHDHKFDPISQRDYYGLQAVFSGSKEVEFPIIDAMGIADFKQHYPRILAVEESRRALRLFDARTAGRPLSPPETAERAQLLTQIANAVLAIPEQTALGVPLVGLMETPTISVLGHERPPLVPPIHLLHRGDLARPREQVGPALPEALRRASGWTESIPGPAGSRATLARWLTDPRHPLTARVMVNRVWQGHFGRGLVASVNDFGHMGERPTHPELLDWLAGEFVRQGWSLKKMHRLLLRSATYQMDSRFLNEANSRIDPSNHYLWKANRRRLEAEALWDSLHAVAGSLNLKMGGRPVMPPLAPDEGAPAYWIVSADPTEHTRRGLYIVQRRNFRFPMFDVFDLPVNAVSAPARDVTTVAPQALWLLNNRTAVRQAESLAARLLGNTEESWNRPTFGRHQPGWEGAKSGIHAGWAKRVESENNTPDFDDPNGTILTHGRTSVAWKMPAGSAGPTQLSGALWNIRHLGRSGPWKVWKNDTLLTEGTVDDRSGSSAKPMALAGTHPDALNNLPLQPGDVVRLEILEDDFVAVQFTIKTPDGTHDLTVDFTLDANPTALGWHYCESLGNGGTPLAKVIRARRTEDPEALVEAAWRAVLARRPRADEKQEALALLRKLSPTQPHAALAQLCLALFNLQEFAYVD